MIIAQARGESLTAITSDKIFQKYDVALLSRSSSNSYKHLLAIAS